MSRVSNNNAVSVVIPVFNAASIAGGKFLIEAIESVYAQTRLPSEVIVVDDGSDDDTPSVLRQFDGRDGFRSFRKPRGGPASASNFGVEQASGEYIAFLDHDDLWQPEKLERQLAQFKPNWGMSITAYELTRPDDTRQVCRFQTWDPDPRAVTRLLERGSAPWGPSSVVVVRREVLQRVGPFEQPVPLLGADWLMWLRIAAAGHAVGYLPDVLTEYRWHGQNLNYIPGCYYDAACGVFDAYGDRRLRASWRVAAAADAQERGDRQGARRRILQAARIRPRAVRPGWVKLLL